MFKFFFRSQNQTLGLERTYKDIKANSLYEYFFSRDSKNICPVFFNLSVLRIHNLLVPKYLWFWQEYPTTKSPYYSLVLQGQWPPCE